MSPPSALAPSDLIFPEASKSLSSTLTSLRRSNLSISNRLRSIKLDADFVRKVAGAYQLPLIANERCGSWYIRPSEKVGSVYFKSTDGHFGQWSFNQRRLNLHLLDVIGKHGGCIIVDSTRRGKSMPDALSKTIPIWTSVLNRYLFPEIRDSHALHTPEGVISPSEHAQIEDRLAVFVRDLRRLEIDAEPLRASLRGKPFRVKWITPDSSLTDATLSSVDKHTIVLCTASGRTATSQSSLSSYVQGAADDSESWANGLTAATFWGHEETLLSTPEDDLPSMIDALGRQAHTPVAMELPVPIDSTGVSLSNNAAMEHCFMDFDIVVSCSEKPNDKISKLGDRYIHLACTTGKVGSRQLREHLPNIEVIGNMLCKGKRVLVSCPSGRDLAVGIALALLCLRRRSLDPSVKLDKPLIKQFLSRIMLLMPDAAPSRATLQSINAFLLDQSPKHPP